MFKFILMCILVLMSSCKDSEVFFEPAKETVREEPEVPPPSNFDDDETIRNVGPSIRVVQKPQNHFLGDRTSLVYRIKAGDSSIKKVNCLVDGSKVKCDKKEDEIVLENLGLGQHVVAIEAIDTRDLTEKKQLRWLISNSYSEVEQLVEVKEEQRQADILFVIDNSKSMDENQRKVGEKITFLFDKIKALSWRLGIITTDPFPTPPNGGDFNPLADGSLLKFPGGTYSIDSTMPRAFSRSEFIKTINRPEIGSGYERGIRNTYRSIERSIRPKNTPEDKRLNQFFRSNAPLSVIVISDENETTRDGNGNPIPDAYRSDGQKLVDYVEKNWGTEKGFRFNSVIVRDQDHTCLKEKESFGIAYEDLTRLTGGRVEDICAPDYSGVLDSIGEGILDLHRTFLLECVPQDADADGIIDLKIGSGLGNRIPGYILDGKKIQFDRPLSPDSYQFVYSCLDSVPN